MRILILLLLAALYTACDDDDLAMPTPPRPPLPMDAISFLALGDSYTIGTGVTPEARWPRQLLDSLSLRNVINNDLTANDLDIVAVNGWTTGNLLAGIDRANLRPEYDLVSLLIGVNNQFQGRSLEEYRAEFAELLDIAVNRAGGLEGRVFVVSIPDYGFTPFGSGRPNVSAEIDEFNAAAVAIAGARGVRFFNITPISRQARDEPNLVAGDNLHPSEEQYRRWVAQILVDEVASLLN